MIKTGKGVEDRAVKRKVCIGLMKFSLPDGREVLLITQTPRPLDGR